MDLWQGTVKIILLNWLEISLRGWSVHSTLHNSREQFFPSNTMILFVRCRKKTPPSCRQGGRSCLQGPFLKKTTVATKAFNSRQVEREDWINLILAPRSGRLKPKLAVNKRPRSLEIRWEKKSSRRDRTTRSSLFERSLGIAERVLFLP